MVVHRFFSVFILLIASADGQSDDYEMPDFGGGGFGGGRYFIFNASVHAVR
jgi:hypothetical protein